MLRLTAVILHLMILLCTSIAHAIPPASFTVFDSATEQPTIKKTFTEEGFVVVSNVSTDTERENLANLVRKLGSENPQARTAGFFDLYHDDTLAQLRQNPNLYQTFANLYDNKKLWVVFDRIIYMTEVNRAEKLPLHVDQNPYQHPDFTLMQALLAISDINEETGMLALIPGSHRWFKDYRQWSNEKQGWIAYQGNDEPERWQQLRSIPLKKGQMVIWDSRTTHSRANSTANPGSSKERIMAMISFQPAVNSDALRQARIEAFQKGVGVYNHDAGLRKTGGGWKGSLRQNPEHLTELGRKLYGIETWTLTSN